MEPAVISQALKGGYSLHTGRYKYIRGAGVSGDEEELYDLVLDPLETENLRDELPDVLASLRQKLDEELARLTDVRLSEVTETAPIDEDFQEKLRALGYLD